MTDNENIPKFLLNVDTGVVFPATPLLLKHGGGNLVPCDNQGARLYVPGNNEEVERAGAEFILNPDNGAVYEWTPLLAAQCPPMVPVGTREEAAAYMENKALEAAVEERSNEPTIEQIETARDAMQAQPLPDDMTTGGDPIVDPVAGDVKQPQYASNQQPEDAIDAGGLPATDGGYDLEAMTKAQLCNLALAKFQETLDGRASKSLLVEQVRVLVQNADDIAA